MYLIIIPHRLLHLKLNVCNQLLQVKEKPSRFKPFLNHQITFDE